MNAASLARLAVDTIKRLLLQNLPDGVEAWEIEEYFRLYGEALLPGWEEAVAPFAAASAPAVPAGAISLPAELWKKPERTEANLSAMRLVARGAPYSPEEFQQMLLYSGWGGLHIKPVLQKLPEGLRPEERGLVHEYYTPRDVVVAVAEAIRPLLPGLVGPDGSIAALEPSAGIGRFVNALSGPGFEAIRWTAVEYSHVSASLLRAIRPDITLFEGPFEKWVAEHGAARAGHLPLLLSNPPYGERGAALTLDPDRSYREKRYYRYFLRRGLDLLQKGGLGVFLIPYGFLSGRSEDLYRLRDTVLRRHHLSAAFRLPSYLFPGAGLATDLLFFRARGGEVSAVLPDDKFIAEGNYYEENPTHILGQEVGSDRDDEVADVNEAERELTDAEVPRGRTRYKIEGVFSGLPPLLERPFCTECTVTPYLRPVVKRVAPAPVAGPGESENEEALTEAELLGQTLHEYLTTVSRQEDEDQRARAQALHRQLLPALRGWASIYGDPHQMADLLIRAQAAPVLQGFLQAFQRGKGGEVMSSLLKAPAYTPRYRQALDDLEAQAKFLYRQTQRLTPAALHTWHHAQGGTHSAQAFDQVLQQADWALDWPEHAAEALLVPPGDYYTGHLWPKYDRARERAAEGNARAQAQAERLLALIAPESFSSIEVEPRSGWLPFTVLQAFLEDWTKQRMPPLVRDQSLVAIQGVTYTEMSVADKKIQIEVGEDVYGVGRTLRALMGYLNHDKELFDPDELLYAASRGGIDTHFEDQEGLDGKQRKKGAFAEFLTQEEEEDLDKRRLEFHRIFVAAFQGWIGAHPEHQPVLTEAYNRAYRGYVTPTYDDEDISIARWGKKIKLSVWQRAGLQMFLANRGGLLAFDVGVGKTYTGVALVAKALEQGWAQRPVVLCPNSLLWNWHRSFSRALPDFRVVVIGAHRFQQKGKPGEGPRWRTRTDTPRERGDKWRRFMAGLYDVVILSDSMMPRTLLKTETVEAYVRQSPEIQREINLPARNKVKDAHSAQNKGIKERAIKERRVAQLSDRLTLVRDYQGKSTLRVTDAVKKWWKADAALSAKYPEFPVIWWQREEEAEAARVEILLGYLQHQSKKDVVLQDPVYRLILHEHRLLRLSHDELLRLTEEASRVGAPLSERQAAVRGELLQGFVAEKLELPPGHEPDPGIHMEDIGIDLVVVDEAQSKKNLYAVADREGGMPAFLGAVSDGSNRAFQFDFRSAVVRARAAEIAGRFGLDPGAAGVALLSATPFKNSPLEIYVMIHYLRPQIWWERGIFDVQQFMDRYLIIETEQIVTMQLDVKDRAVVKGFKNLHELRDVIFRFGLFKRAEDVGLKLPDAQPVEVPLLMSDAQERLYEMLLGRLIGEEEAVVRETEGEGDPEGEGKKKSKVVFGEGKKAKGDAILGIIGRMNMVAIHPELDRGDADADGNRSQPKWDWKNADDVKDPHAPKLDACADRVMATPGCGHIIFCDLIAVHRWLQKVLIERGIPEDRIAVLNGEVAKTPLSRQEIADAFNGQPAELRVALEGQEPDILSMYDLLQRYPDVAALAEQLQEGETLESTVTGQDGISRPIEVTILKAEVAARYDVVIANAVAYEGIDLQVRTCAIHHLDLPWEPATLQQRNGRGVRQGNPRAVIAIYYYLAKHSLDQARLQLITGKIGWMQTLIKGSDRKTNNPAATSTLSREERLAMATRNPEELKKRLEAVAAKKREEELQRRRAEAWQSLRSLALRTKEIARQSDPNMATALSVQRDAIARQLRQLDEEVFGWKFLIPVAESGTQMLFSQPPGQSVVWEGARLVQEPGGFEIGRIFTTGGALSFALRPFGSPVLQVYPAAEVSEVFEDEPLAWQRAWPPAEEVLLERKLDEIIVKIRDGDFARFSTMNHTAALDPYRQWLWQKRGAALLSALQEGGEHFDLPIPAVRGERLILLVPAQIAGGGEVLPFTDEGFERFLGLAPNAGYSYTELSRAADFWWRRPVPKGLVRKMSGLRTVPGALLQEGLDAVRWAIADPGHPQPALTALLLQGTGTRATNGHVVAVWTGPGDWADLPEARLTKAQASDLSRYITGAEEVRIARDAESWLFLVGDKEPFEVPVKFPGGPLPDLSTYLEDEADRTPITVSREEFFTQLQRLTDQVRTLPAQVDVDPDVARIETSDGCTTGSEACRLVVQSLASPARAEVRPEPRMPLPERMVALSYLRRAIGASPPVERIGLTIGATVQDPIGVRAGRYLALVMPRLD